MNKETIQGTLEQVAGKVKEAFGEATGNQKIANAGAADQITGVALETWGKTKDAASDIAASTKADADVSVQQHKEHAAETAHDVRSKVVSTAQNVKDSIVENLNESKQKHAR
jgi:uncharacterized protein YjbJ (UPF0337 family)